MKEEFEQKIEYGKNILQRDFYYRHGDKTPEGELSLEGFKQAEDIGKVMETTEKGPKPYGSEIKRAQDFTETIRRATESSKEYKTRTKKELGFSGLSKEFLAQWKQIAKEQGDDAVIKWYFAFGKNRPDANTISPYEMACRTAKNIFTHNKMAERYRAGSKVDMVNGSHSPTLDVFIATALEEQIEKNPINPEGKDLIEKMGGKFKTAEGFEVNTIIDGEGKKSLILKFRGKEFPLDENKLEEMVEDFEKTKKE